MNIVHKYAFQTTDFDSNPAILIILEGGYSKKRQGNHSKNE